MTGAPDPGSAQVTYLCGGSIRPSSDLDVGHVLGPSSVLMSSALHDVSGSHPAPTLRSSCDRQTLASSIMMCVSRGS